MIPCSSDSRKKKYWEPALTDWRAHRGTDEKLGSHGQLMLASVQQGSEPDPQMSTKKPLMPPPFSPHPLSLPTGILLFFPSASFPTCINLQFLVADHLLCLFDVYRAWLQIWDFLQWSAMIQFLVVMLQTQQLESSLSAVTYGNWPNLSTKLSTYIQN